MQRRELFSAFESLGNNCELGFVQDAAGCTGVSLFKNVGFDRTEQLIDALDAGLAGMFEAGAYDFLCPEGWPDYALDCRRFGFRFHTGMPADTPDASQQFDTLLSAFRWLRDKFLQDLQNGEKIFTYRHHIQFDESLVQRLLASLRRHGPGWLLWVRQDERPDRCFAWAEHAGVDGLIYGGMPYLVAEPPPRPAYDGWEQIARRALRLRNGVMPLSPTNAAVRRVAAGGAADTLPVAPGGLFAVQTWLWLPKSFAGTRLDFAVTGGEVGRGRPVDVSIREQWQPVWAPVRVAPNQTRLGLGFNVPEGGSTFVYTNGWTVRRMEVGTRPAVQATGADRPASERISTSPTRPLPRAAIIYRPGTVRYPLRAIRQTALISAVPPNVPMAALWLHYSPGAKTGR